MNYNIYKNCSEQQFVEFKKRLEQLNATILERYSDQLAFTAYYDSPDSLALNYTFIKDNSYQSNLCILFDDKSSIHVFNVGVVKSIDVDSIRYAKREVIASRLTIDFISENLAEIISLAIQKYFSWDKQTLLNSERIDLNYEGPFLER